MRGRYRKRGLSIPGLVLVAARASAQPRDFRLAKTVKVIHDRLI